jgi:uncharacterized protein (TIGR04141 family)
LDVDRDLLRAVTGVPRDRRYGTRLTGMDSLVAQVRTELDDLPPILDDSLLEVP